MLLIPNLSTSIVQILESANQCLALLCTFSSFSMSCFMCGFQLVICIKPQYCTLVSGDLSFLSYLKFNYHSLMLQHIALNVLCSCAYSLPRPFIPHSLSVPCSVLPPFHMKMCCFSCPNA